MEQLYIVHFVVAAILAGVAFAVRFAGTRRVLNVVDYSRVTDMRGLHRWASNRMFPWPPVIALLGVLSLNKPGIALLLIFALMVCVLAMVITVCAGTSRFYTHPPGQTN